MPGKKIGDLNAYGSINTDTSRRSRLEIDRNSGTYASPVYGVDDSCKITLEELKEALFIKEINSYNQVTTGSPTFDKQSYNGIANAGTYTLPTSIGSYEVLAIILESEINVTVNGLGTGIPDLVFTKQNETAYLIDTTYGWYPLAVNKEVNSSAFELLVNKENTTLDTSSTKYPTNNLVKTYVDNLGNTLTSGLDTKLTKANNLSDLTNTSQARDNLLLGATNDVTHNSITLSNTTVSTLPFIDSAKKIISATGALLGTWFQTLTAKSTPVDADTFIVNDSASSFESKKTTLLQLWSNYLLSKVESLDYLSGSGLSNTFLPCYDSTGNLINSLAKNNTADGGIDINSGYIYARKTTGGYAAYFDFRGNSGSSLNAYSQKSKAIYAVANTNRTTSDPASIIINSVSNTELCWFISFDKDTTQRNATSQQNGSIFLQRSGRNSASADISNNGYNVGIFARLSPNVTDNKDINGSFNFTQVDYVNNKGAWIAYVAGVQVASIGQDGVAIGSSTINDSAQLELQSTTKGFLKNRLTSAQIASISTPAQGLEMFDTDLRNTVFLPVASGNPIRTIGTMFTQTANKQVQDTITETSLVGTGVGSATIKANSSGIGTTYRLSMCGYISNTGTPFAQVKVKIGSVTVFDTTSTGMFGITSNQPFKVNAVFTVRTLGASGTVIGQGEFEYATSASTQYQIMFQANTATSTIDTTADQTVDITFTWGTANASNSINSTNFTLERL